jgi:hypothetical protein
MNTYTLHVSLPGYGRVWRKLELPAESTLEDLHLAIQSAFEFDNDHLYSFFMSGKAWDSSTEYSLPDGVGPDGFSFMLDEDDEDSDLDDEGEEGEDELLEDEAGDPSLPDPTNAQLREMLSALSADPVLRAEAKKTITEQFGIPGFLFDMIINNSDQMMALLENEGLDDDEIGGDVRTTTLESLDLKKGKTFLYLFDYGDDWRFKVKVSAVNPKADASAAYPRVVESVGEAPSQYGNLEDEEEWEEEEGDEPE